MGVKIVLSLAKVINFTETRIFEGQTLLIRALCVLTENHRKNREMPLNRGFPIIKDSSEILGNCA